ncbi:hypothetical protein BCV72DRAFT_237404 [Rhizopus microsporus var. microsporus]|uniref:Uncharacterized protein n=2 Tax=Rhizopus microsporus TaxID=58291 RepID=A0A2G4SWP4_RHIZD|nr:uncharacterized protein RHIMIDRAFT_281515 [Rhizopus microsporus ATCC 52813]ORE00774.1 hypothetical protein BCV72DRAFT_237404 [Rhizopus microsporus var. microsporus]PHZ13162.1 hypothetical protein RHIMIDRAFT_281515 [Rhizopus microsporus ATCC 52813]
MSTSESDINPLYKEVICPVLLKLAENTDEIHMQDVIDQLADYIVEETDQSATTDMIKSSWTKRFFQSAKLTNVVLLKENTCWEPVVKRIHEKASNNNNNDHDNSNTTSNTTSSTSSSSTLKRLLTEEDKANIKKMFSALDPAKFWYLKATCDQAAKDNVDPESVEEKMKRFALECVYHQ